MAAYTGVRLLLRLDIPGWGRLDVVPLSISTLDSTGEGIVPYTSRLGALTVKLAWTSELAKAFATVDDYADVTAALLDVTDPNNPGCLFFGVGDRKGWSSERRGRGTVTTATFCSEFEAQGDVTVEDTGGDREAYAGGRPFDTIPWTDAVALIAKTTHAKVVASFPELVLNGYSVVRRVTPRLIGRTGTDAGKARAVAALPGGAVAVGCGSYVLLFKDGAWYPGVHIFYRTTGHAYDREVTAGGWSVVALGYRAGTGHVHGLIGTPNGVVGRFSFAPAYAGPLQHQPITGADCFRWFWDHVDIQSYFTQWRSYNGAGQPEAFKDTYAIGYPILESDKDAGGLSIAARSSLLFADYAPAGSSTFRLTLASAVAAEDRLEAGGSNAEFLGRVVRVQRFSSYQAVTTDRPASLPHAKNTAAYVYAARTWPTANICLPRPMALGVTHVDPSRRGGNPILPVQVVAHRGPGGGDMGWWRPVVSEDAPEGETDPGYIALQADPALVLEGDRYFTDTPRQFWAVVPGACPFPPDVANQHEYRQERTGTTADQGRVTLYKNGTARTNGHAAGAMVTAGDYLLREAMASKQDGVGAFYYTRLELLKWNANANKYELLWRSREDDDATTGIEYYVTSGILDDGAALYVGVRSRERRWVQLDAQVLWASFAQTDAPGSRGAVSVALRHHVGEELDDGMWLRFHAGGEAFLALEVSEVRRALSGTGTCPCGSGFHGALTVVSMAGPQFASAEDIRTYFCATKPWVARSWTEKTGVLRYDKATKAVTYHPVKYNPATPKMDEAASFLDERTYGETMRNPDMATPSFAVFKAENKRVAAGTVAVYVDGVAFTVTDVTDDYQLPAPTRGVACVNYRAGDAEDELWVYLPAEYERADVVVAYDYHPLARVTAVWPWRGAVYYATDDGYLWQWAATPVNVGRTPTGDHPVAVTVGTDRVWFITARGCLAQHARAHSGAIEGDFGGVATRPFELLANVAAAAEVRIKEAGGAYYIGPVLKPVVLDGVSYLTIRDTMPIEYRAVRLTYSGGEVFVGDESAPSEAVARVSRPLIYTPHHAMVVADAMLAAIRRRRDVVEVTGVTDRPQDVLLAAYIQPDKGGDLFEVIGARIDKNRFTVNARRLAVAGASQPVQGLDEGVMA